MFESKLLATEICGSGKRTRVLFDGGSSLDSDYEFKKTKIYNDENVILILNDHQNIDCAAFQLLKSKFAKQQLGKKLWLENRELQYDYIPIEFAKDKQFLIEYANHNINSMDYETPSYLCHWYLIGDELKDDFDIVLNFGLYATGHHQSRCCIDIIEKHCHDNERLAMEIVTKLLDSTCLIGCDLNERVRTVKRLFSFNKKLSMNANLLLEYLKVEQLVFLFADEKVRRDKNFILKALQVNNQQQIYDMNLKKLIEEDVQSSELKNDRDIILEFARNRLNFVKYSDNYKNDREFALELVQIYGELLDYFSEEIKNDREVVLQAIKSGAPLSSASKELQQDREIVLEAVKHNQYVIRGSKFKEDREMVLQAVKRGAYIDLSSTELQQDREIVLQAVKNGTSIFLASTELQKDREVIVEAIKYNGFLLQHFFKEFKNDRELVLKAIISDLRVLAFISCDRDIILEAVKINGMALGYVSNNLKNDREIVIAAVQNNADALKYISDAFHNEIIFDLIEVIGELAFTKQLKTSKETALKLVRQNGYFLKHLYRYQSDYQVVLEAIKQNPISIIFSKLYFRNGVIDDEDYDYEDEEYKKYDEFMSKCAKMINCKYPRKLLEQIAYSLNRFTNSELMYKLVKYNPNAIHYFKGYTEFDKKVGFDATLLENGYWTKFSEDYFQERIIYGYHGAKIYAGSEINYYRNRNKEFWNDNCVWTDSWLKRLCPNSFER